MSIERLAAARIRLEAAVARLEGSVSGATRASEQSDLGDQLRMARADYTALLAVTDNVADRLDGAILRLNGILEVEADEEAE